MSARLSKEDKLLKVVERYRVLVESYDGVPRSPSQLSHRKLGTLAREAGYERVSMQFREELDAEFRKSRIGTFPDLTDPDNTRETRIALFDLDKPIPGFQPSRVLFDREEHLSRSLKKNFKVLKFFKRQGLVLRDREMRIAPGEIIDLLATDKKTGHLVGIELKVAEPGDRITGQTDKYMASLVRLANREKRPGARLLIITGQPDQKAKAAIETLSQKHGVPVTWLVYKVSIDLAEAP